MKNNINFDSVDALYIYGESDDAITFTGCLHDSICAYAGRFRIIAGDVVIHYEWNDIAGWCAQIIENTDRPIKSEIVLCNPDNLGEIQPDEGVPVVVIPFDVKAVKIESLTIGGKITGVEYLINKSTELSPEQQHLFERINEISPDLNDSLVERYGEGQIKGWLYFNLK